MCWAREWSAHEPGELFGLREVDQTRPAKEDALTKTRRLVCGGREWRVYEVEVSLPTETGTDPAPFRADNAIDAMDGTSAESLYSERTVLKMPFSFVPRHETRMLERDDTECRHNPAPWRGRIRQQSAPEPEGRTCGMTQHCMPTPESSILGCPAWLMLASADAHDGSNAGQQHLPAKHRALDTQLLLSIFPTYPACMRRDETWSADLPASRPSTTFVVAPAE